MSTPRPRKLSFPSRIPKKTKKTKDLRQMPPVPRQMPDVAAISLRSLFFLVFLGIFEGSDRFLGRGFDLLGFFGNPRTKCKKSRLSQVSEQALMAGSSCHGATCRQQQKQCAAADAEKCPPSGRASFEQLAIDKRNDFHKRLCTGVGFRFSAGPRKSHPNF